MDDASKLDAAIRILLRTLSIDERRAPKFATGERIGLLDMELLALIAESPGIQAKALVELLGVKPTTMQSAVNRLVHREIIYRDTESLKGRSVALQLTKVGTNLVKDIRAHNLRNCKAILAGLDPEEVPPFLSSMAKLTSTLTEPS
jgi:DNA-binding MarR family transcriptional regulator